MQFIGIVTAMTLTSVGALADDHTQQGSKQTLRGHIMPLQQYLSQGAESQRDLSQGVRPGTATLPGTVNQPGSANRQPGVAGQPGTSTQAGNQPRVGGTGVTDQNPRPGGVAGGVNDASRTTPQTGTLFGGVDNQIMVLIATGHSDKPASAADPNRAQATPTRPEAYTSGQNTSSLAGQRQGQAYILICDPKDHASLATLAGYASDRAGNVDRSSTTPTPILEQNADQDRQQVRDEVRSNDRPLGLGEREKDPAGNQGTQAWSQGMKHGEVKVTGKVMERGGLQAIQVASIEKVDASGARSGENNPGSTTQPRNESDRRE